MLKNFMLPLVVVLFSMGTAMAQRVCAAEEVLHQQLLENPMLKQQMEEIERHTEQFIQSGGVHDRVVVTIPVVFNVVWNTAAENLSDAQLQSQLDVLNADFRRLNSDAGNVPSVWQSIAADVEVNFCLATQDPNGAATTGIRRLQTSITSFSTNDNVKRSANGGLDAWDRNKYLNLWVCDISGGILGYAQFPGGAAATDGVVLDYAYVGLGSTPPYNLGRTATHEVGHWLNLYHIWGDDGTGCTGTDNCADTPNQADENYGCPTFPNVSCSNGPNGDMFMNYMDYTDDACMYMFTAGQKARAQALFSGSGARVALLSSPGCQAPTGGSCGTPSGLNATGITQTSATLNWSAISGATSYTLQWKLASGSTFTTVSGLTSTSYALSGLTASTAYNFQVRAVCGATTGAYSTLASFTTTAAGGGGCVDQFEPNNTRATAVTVPINTTFTAKIASSTDADWNKFTNTTATKNIKIDLTTLPADYDVKLYRGTSNTVLAVSENAGTASEQIIYNTTAAANTYYAYVYGYNGANSNTQCYTMRVSLSASNFRTDGSTDGPVTEIDVPVTFENAPFGLFPNPASEQVTVEVPMVADQDVSVAILDATGKVALQQHRALSKGDNQMVFNVSQVPTGVHFVQVRNGSDVYTRKLVITK